MSGRDIKSSNDNGSAIGSEPPLWFGMAGAAVGAAVGYFAFFAFLKYASLYTLILPGALIGLGRAVGTKRKSIPLGVACGLLALGISLWIEWQITPRADGGTIAEFVLHLHERPFRNVASIVTGPLMAVWFGVGRSVPGSVEE